MPYPAASVVAVCANVYKQNMIFPAPTASTGGNKNQSEQSLISARLQECCKAHIVLPRASFCGVTSRQQSLRTGNVVRTPQLAARCSTHMCCFSRAAFKNLWRGALLTVMATFLGPFLFFTVPDFLVTTITKGAMPLWFYQSEVRAVQCCLDDIG